MTMHITKGNIDCVVSTQQGMYGDDAPILDTYAVLVICTVLTY